MLIMVPPSAVRPDHYWQYFLATFGPDNFVSTATGVLCPPQMIPPCVAALQVTLNQLGCAISTSVFHALCILYNRCVSGATAKVVESSDAPQQSGLG